MVPPGVSKKRTPGPPDPALPIGPFPFLVLALLLPWPASGQSEYPVVISAGTHSLTAPWYLSPVADGWNPAVMAGTDRMLKSGDDWSFFYGVNIGFFQHRWWMTGLSLEPELGVGRRLPGGLHADVRLGLGYMHYFWRRKVMELDDGRYVEATDWGKPSILLPLSLSLGYRGGPDSPVSVQPFLSARWGVQGLFLDEIPAMTHLLFLGGVRIARGGDTPDGGR